MFLVGSAFAEFLIEKNQHDHAGFYIFNALKFGYSHHHFWFHELLRKPKVKE